jgi:hypothetical protein
MKVSRKLRQIAPGVFDTDHFGRRFLDFPVSTKRAQRRVAALGQKQTFGDTPSNVRYWGQSGHRKGVYSMPLREGAFTVRTEK